MRASIVRILTPVLTLSLAGTAFAQDEAASTETPAAETTPVAPASGEVTEAAGVISKANYPIEVTKRPLTLPKGMVQLGAGYSNSTTKIKDTKVDAMSPAGIEFGAQYGIMDNLQIGLSSEFLLNPDSEWSKDLGVSAHYLVMDSEKLDVAAGVQLPLEFESEKDAGALKDVGPLHGFYIDAATRYLVNDHLFVFGGDQLLQMKLGDDYLNVHNLEAFTGMSLNLRGGVGYEVNQNIAVRVGTMLAHVKLSGDENKTKTIADIFNLTFEGHYAVSNKLDVTADVGYRSDSDADTNQLSFAVGVAYRI